MTRLNPLATPFLPATSTLPTLGDAALASTLDLLFEPSRDLHALALPTMRTVSFESYDDLITTLRDQLLAIAADVTADPDARRPLHAILCAHPRLGEKRASSSQSRAEQASLRAGANDADADATSKADADTDTLLAELNHEYEQRFPGLRYVVFVNGRSRETIVQDMRRRIGRGDLRAEEREAIEAICDIAKDRAAKLHAASPATSIGK